MELGVRMLKTKPYTFILRAFNDTIHSKCTVRILRWPFEKLSNPAQRGDNFRNESRDHYQIGRILSSVHKCVKQFSTVKIGYILIIKYNELFDWLTRDSFWNSSSLTPLILSAQSLSFSRSETSNCCITNCWASIRDFTSVHTDSEIN